MNLKIIKLANYLKNKKLNYEYNLVKKLAQVDTEPDEYGFEPVKKLEGWMDNLSDESLIVASTNLISAVMDTSKSCSLAEKPVGLWYAEGSEWLHFTLFQFSKNYEKINYLYEIKPNYSSGGLNSRGGVLRLSTEEEVLEFSREFGRSPLGYSAINSIAWHEVSSLWDGIEIIPYQPIGYDEEALWYRSWEVGSGCIWRPNGVSSLELISSRPGK